MTITRERKPHHSGRKDRRGSDPCSGERPDKGIRYLYRKYDGRDGVKQTHLPGVFLREVRSDK